MRMKVFTRRYCEYTLDSLKCVLEQAFYTVDRNVVRQVRVRSHRLCSEQVMHLQAADNCTLRASPAVAQL